MEGPSLFLAAQQLKPFKGKVIRRVSGNTTIGIERFDGENVRDIFSWGKHLVFQFDRFAVRIHFMLFGTFHATIQEKIVTGDYKAKPRVPRLAFEFKNGHIEMYSCSIKLLDSKNAKKDYDFSVDLMSNEWDSAKAVKKMLQNPAEEIADVLLDQTQFAGLGNIIKNEILFLAKTKPTTLVGKLPRAKLKELANLAKSFSLQFYAWRKQFKLRKNLTIYNKKVCPLCGGKLVRAETGRRPRRSFFCPVDQTY